MPKAFRIAVLLGAVSTLAACNTSSTQVVSGPWGTGYISTSGPRYSDPWNNGPLVIVQPNEFIDAGGIDPTFRDVTPNPYRATVSLPPDPAPPYPMPGSTNDPGSSPQDWAGQSTHSSTSAGEGTTSEVEIAVRQRTAAPHPSQASSTPPPLTATSVAGGWTAIDSAGKRCKIQLSTSSAVDRFRASATGCSSSELQSVNLWSFNGGSVTLYARDREIARLSGRQGQLTGKLSTGSGGIDLTR